MLDHHPPFTVITVPRGAITQHRQEQFARLRLRDRNNGGRPLALVAMALIILAGCEEWFVEKKPAAKPKPKPAPPALTYRGADVEAIQERWRAFAPRAASTRLAAASADTEAGLFPDDAILNARRYGACDVFDLQLPLHPPMTILDCVDRTEQLPGHYHVAAMCVDLPVDYGVPHQIHGRVVYVRATDRDRGNCLETEEGYCTTEYHEVYGWLLPVAVEIDGTEHHFAVDSEPGYHMLVFKWDEDLYGSLVDRIALGAGDLEFSITHEGVTDKGSASLKPNDAAAVKEHTRRCSRAR